MNVFVRIFSILILLIFIPSQWISFAEKPQKPLPPVPYKPSVERQDAPGSLVDITPGSDIPQKLKDKWDKWSRLQIRVIDGRTRNPIQGAHVVIAETGQRVVTDQNGLTPIIAAPVIRDPRYEEEILQRLHGQLTLIAYKNGYRDTVFFNVRMREGLLTLPEVWMYQITPEDTRIEPMVFHNPTNHLFILELANRFRDERQLGEGWPDPKR